MRSLRWYSARKPSALVLELSRREIVGMRPRHPDTPPVLPDHSYHAWSRVYDPSVMVNAPLSRDQWERGYQP